MNIGITFGLFLLLLAFFAELPDVECVKACEKSKGIRYQPNRVYKGGKNAKIHNIGSNGVIEFKKKGRAAFRIPRGVKVIHIICIYIKLEAEVRIGPIMCKEKKKPCQMMRLKHGAAGYIYDIKLPRKKNKILVILALKFVAKITIILTGSIHSPCKVSSQCVIANSFCYRECCHCIHGYYELLGQCYPDYRLPLWSRSCRALGDPHYTTFDGLHYSFQGMCEYVFAAATNGAWSVITKNEQWPAGTQLSRVAKVTILFRNVTIVIDSADRTVTINGTSEDSFPVIGPRYKYSVSKSGWTVIVRTKIGLIVTYDLFSYITVYVTNRWFNRTWGLCGIWNSSITDEIEMTGDHMELEATTLYGNETCPGPEESPECGDQDAREMAEAICEEEFQKDYCNVNYTDRIDQCALDICACGLPCLCSHLHSYLDECFLLNTTNEQYNRDPCIGCPNGWFQINERCYKLFKVHKTQADATNHCDALEAHIATFRTLAEQMLLDSYYEDENIWMGITKVGPSEGVVNPEDFAWIDNGDTLTESSPWDVDEPSEDGDCVVGWAASQSFRVSECDNTAYFVCEKGYE